MRCSFVMSHLRDFDFFSFGHILRNEIVQSYDSSILKFLKDLHAVFHKDYINLHSHQKCFGFLSLHILSNTCCHLPFG